MFRIWLILKRPNGKNQKKNLLLPYQELLNHTLAKRTKGVVSHFCGLAIYIKKVFLRQKEELWKFKYFTMQRYKSSKKKKKNPLKETKILQALQNSITTNLKFQHKPKYHLSKILMWKETLDRPKSLKLPVPL